MSHCSVLLEKRLNEHGGGGVYCESQDGMRFYIRWLRGPLAGTIGQETFASYEAAVEAEVAAINKMRLAGTSFA